MTFRGTRSGAKYRNFAIALALFASMLVVFAFTFIASTTRLHADTKTANVATWNELKNEIAKAKADKSNKYEITLTKDLVACDQIAVEGNVKIKGNKTIYRHDGDTDFSVFKVKDGGNLELSESVTMSGYVAKVKSDAPSFDGGNGDAEWKVYWNIGYGTDESFAVESTKNGLTRGTGLSCTVPNNLIPEGYYFVGWRVKGFPGISGEEVLTNAQMKEKVKVPATGGGVLRVKAKWAKKTIYQGSKDLRTHPENGTPYNNSRYTLRKKPYGQYDLIRYAGLQVSLAASDPDGGFKELISPNSGTTPNGVTTEGYFYLHLGSASAINMYKGGDGNYHIRKFTAGEDGSWDDLKWSPGSLWKYENGMIVNVLNTDYCLVYDNGALKLAEKNAVAGETINYANKYWNDGNNSDGYKAWEPSYNATPAVDGTEIDTTVNYSKESNAAQYYDKVEYVRNDKNLDPLTDEEADEADPVQAHQEVFNSGKGFFVQVEEGGSLNISGAVLKNFNTLTITEANKENIAKSVPEDVAPVYVKGGKTENKTTGFTMSKGSIEENKVGYVAIESNSKDKTVQEIKKYLDDTPFTNTAGGVIFTGKNTVGAIKGTARIRLNKADAGGIIVTDEATVTLGQDGISGTGNAGGINKNVGFHHSGAALVEDGGKMFLRDSGEMGYNVTWARGGAVWATEWGTNGYVKANWNGWPTTFPVVTNPEIRQKDGGHFIMIGGEVHNNTAFIRSGAIEVESNGVELYGGVIEKNNCRSLGGAIYVEGDAADYSYTLFVKEGYIGNNVAVKMDNKEQKSVTVDNQNTVNYVLDRYLKDGALNYCEAHGNGTNGTTYDRDFLGAMGNGGGVWLCPVGGTSVFADGGKDVIIDENTATGTGTDFYLSRGNGAVMVQDLKGDWYKQNGQNTVGDKLNFDNANGTVLNGPLAMKNMRNPAMQHSGGVKIQSNQSRDGGGIACNGTLMLGGPKDVFRYDARVNLTKKWETTTGPEKVTFDLYYKENGERKGGVIKSLELNGEKDEQTSGTGVEGVNNVGGQDIEGEWTEDSDGDWTGGLVLPQYVEINGEKKALYVFKFDDPDNSSQKLTYDPVQDNLDIRDKLYRAVQKVPATEEQLADGRVKIVRKLELDVQSNFELVERGGKYKVDFGNLEASATATSEMIELMNPAAGTSTTKFYVTFTTAEFAATATNKDKELEIPAHKKWLDEYGMVYATKKPNGVTWAENNLQNDNGYMRFINWPESGVDRYALTLEGGKAGGPARKYTISLEDIKPLVTGNSSDMTNASDSKVFNQGTKIEDRYIEWNDNRGKAKLSLEKTKYYIIYDVNGNLVYAEPAETVDPQCNNSNGGSKEYNWPADYMVAKAKALLIQRGKTQAEANALIKRGIGGGATTNNPADGFCQYGERVYLYTPKLVYTVAAKDETGADYTYTLSEEDINSYTEKITGNQEDGFKVANRYAKTKISAEKNWIDYDGNILMTQSFGSHEFKVDGSSVWVNWPSANTEYVRIKLEDKAAGSTWKREDIIDANAIKDYLADPNRSWDAGRGSATIKFDKETYCVVLEKTTNKVVMTIPKSEIQTQEGQSVAQVAISRAAVKSGKQESELKMEERLVYFPKVVYNIDKFSSENVLAKYVITELGVGSGSYDNGSNMRTDDYVPKYYDAAGRIINYNSSIEDADKHLETMKAGITICNERKVNVKLTKKWRDNLVSSTTLPAGVTAKFQLMKYDENQKKFVDVAGQEKTLTSGSTLEWTGLAPGRYAVRESSVPNGYITDMPTDGTAEVTISHNTIGQDVFEFTATNTKLTEVEAAKKWNARDTFPNGITSVDLFLKRWYKFDSFGKEIWQRILNSTTTASSNSNRLYILKGSVKKYVVLDSTTNRYYVEDNGKHPVQHNGYVEIDGMIYAIQGGKTVTQEQKQYNDSIVRDHNDEYVKVLVDPKDKNGNVISNAKAAKAGSPAKWSDLPKYDESIKVSGILSDEQKKQIRKIEYWIKENSPDGYLEYISGDMNNNKYTFTVNNTKTQNLSAEAKKIWDDGDPESRPTIRFELWRQTYNATSGIWLEGTDNGWSKLVGTDSHGQPYDYEITSDTSASDLTHRWTNLPDSRTENGKTYYYNYAPREAILIGQDSDNKDVYVYVNRLSYAISDAVYNDYPSNKGEIDVEYDSQKDEYTVTVWRITANGERTGDKIDEAKNIKKLDNRAISYQNGRVIAYQSKGEYSKPTGNAVCWAHDLVAYNTRPAIEKYINQDVHQDLQNNDEVFTYDIMAYVPKWSKKIVINDDLVKALTFVDKNGKTQYQTGFNKDQLVTVTYMSENNHNAKSMKDANTSSTVTDVTGTTLSSNLYSVGTIGKPSIDSNPYSNKLTVTIEKSSNSTPKGIDKILENSGEKGMWVKVSFKAKIKDELVLDDMSKEELKALGFETIDKNEPVNTKIATHTGFKNQADYDVTLTNNYSFDNEKSNIVTVVSPSPLTLKKKVTGTLGDLTKQFVFHIEFTGLNTKANKTGSERDYEYSENVNEAGKPYVYMDADMANNHQTYNNGFNISTSNNPEGKKELWVKLKANQSLTIKDLPVGATYKVTEYANDHAPSYKINDVANVKEASRKVTTEDVIAGRLVKINGEWVKATAEMVQNSNNNNTLYTVAANVKVKDGSSSGSELAMATDETVEPGEIVIVTYTNHRDIMTETGIISDTWPWNIILLIVLVLLAYDDQMRKIKNRLRINRISQV